MTIWWESLTNLQQILALMAIPATLLMVLQTLLLLFGLGGHGEADTGGAEGADIADGPGLEHDISPHDGDISHHEAAHGHHDSGLRVFTVRAFVAFFSIFGWLGIVLLSSGMSAAPAIAISFAAGAAAMVGMAYFFKFALGLQSAGNIDIRNSLGKTATVYLPIPPNRSGRGKVTVLVQGRLSEVEAVTDCDYTIKTGTEVVGVSVTNQNVICVTPVGEK